MSNLWTKLFVYNLFHFSSIIIFGLYFPFSQRPARKKQNYYGHFIYYYRHSMSYKQKRWRHLHFSPFSQFWFSLPLSLSLTNVSDHCTLQQEQYRSVFIRIHERPVNWLIEYFLPFVWPKNLFFFFHGNGFNLFESSHSRRDLQGL